MPVPSKIEQPTRVMGRPAGTLEEDCGALPIRDIHDPIWGNQMWSKWEFTDEDRAAVAAGGALYLIITGTTHPVVAVAVEGVQ